MAKLLFFLIIFLIPVGLAHADTYNSTNPVNDGYVTDTTDNDICATGGAKDTAGVQLLWQVNGVDTADDCYFTFLDYDISSIPTSATILDVDVTIDAVAGGTADNCDWVSMGTTRASDSAANIFTAILGGTVMINNDATCQTDGSFSLDLGTVGDAQVQARVVAGSGFFTYGVKLDDLTPLAGLAVRGHAFQSEDDGTATPRPTLTIVYDAGLSAVTTLAATDVRGTSVDLSWTAPSIASGSIVGYQINYTTPHGSPLTVINANTSSTLTTATVSPLTGLTNYSFRVSAISNAGTYNASGNIVNVTTDIDPTAAFTPGTFDLDQTGEDVRDITFERNDINANDMWLNITVDTDWNLACDIHYKFVNTNQTYTNIANTTIDSETDAVAFRFNNVENEVIDVFCWDQYNLDNEGRFVITQADFPLLEQMSNFTSGVYGTEGMFGSLDLITMIVVIISMIGFNRNNEMVGIILSMFLIGGIAVLSAGQIISWGPTFTAVFALLIMWGIGTMRKG